MFRAQLTNEAVRSKRECFQAYFHSPNSKPLGLSGEVKVENGPYFTHLFVDEAAQATEPEILCPISCVLDPHVGVRKVEIALVGDPRQLSPRVYSPDVEFNLGRSFMERLLRRTVTCMGGGEESLLGPEKQTADNAESLSDLIRYYAEIDGQEQLTIFLTENYRGHPSFLMMPSSLFYFDRLQSVKAPDFANLSSWCEKLRKVEALASRIDVRVESSPDANVQFTQIYRQTTWPLHFRGVEGTDTAIIENISGNFIAFHMGSLARLVAC